MKQCDFCWQNYSALGDELGLQDDEIDEIPADDSGFKGVEGCLSMWLNCQKGKQDKTWQVLLEAIKNIRD